MSDWGSWDSIGKALVLGAPVIMEAYVELSFPLVMEDSHHSPPTCYWSRMFLVLPHL